MAIQVFFLLVIPSFPSPPSPLSLSSLLYLPMLFHFLSFFPLLCALLTSFYPSFFPFYFLSCFLISFPAFFSHTQSLLLRNSLSFFIFLFSFIHQYSSYPYSFHPIAHSIIGYFLLSPFSFVQFTMFLLIHYTSKFILVFSTSSPPPPSSLISSIVMSFTRCFRLVSPCLLVIASLYCKGK